MSAAECRAAMGRGWRCAECGAEPAAACEHTAPAALAPGALQIMVRLRGRLVGTAQHVAMAASELTVLGLVVFQEDMRRVYDTRDGGGLVLDFTVYRDGEPVVTYAGCTFLAGDVEASAVSMRSAEALFFCGECQPA